MELAQIKVYSKMGWDYFINKRVDVSLWRQFRSVSKITYRYLTNKVNIIDTADFKVSYDSAAQSFDQWNDKMGIVSDKIVDLEFIASNTKPWHLLDFGCGTGYITKKLMKSVGHDVYKITGIDLSSNMIDICKSRINDERVTFLNVDGIEYLKNAPDNEYDGIFCTWALEYVPQDPFFTHIHRALKDRGQLGLAVSKRGTIVEVESCIMEIMAEYPDMVKGVLDISCFLPEDMRELKKKVVKYGFNPVKMEEGFVELSFDSPEEMFDWLLGTGDIAGAMQMFKDADFFKSHVLEKIRAKLYKDGKYTTYQTYVYGIFAKI
ncbi:MAG: methyltransferase domain-containing protein [Proteobacteria bacterium]|nr:methyltransferase domain-containing protein [Pseudomonadota bacterium]